MTERAPLSPEETLAWHFMQRAQEKAPNLDARRAGPTSFDRQAAHDALAALREAGWRVIRAIPRPRALTRPLSHISPCHAR